LETEHDGTSTPCSDNDFARGEANFFSATDWGSLALATAVVLAGYWFSLATNVGLGDSGIYSIAAMYVGVPTTPGYPLWTMYAWLFTKLLPFSNITWRIAVSSAAAGALTCGIIALMVSRGSAALLETIPNFRRLARIEEQTLRLVAGGIAGMTFGFNRAFWCHAVMVDVWPLSILLLSLVLCLLMQWAHQPRRRNCFHAACLVFGLTITNSQALIPAGLGLLFLVAFTCNSLGRDAALVASTLLIAWLVGDFLGFLPGGGMVELETKCILILMMLVTIGLYMGLTKRTRRLRPSPAIFLATMLFFTGTSFYLLVPIFSMANPPVNWGYPRTLKGFAHMLSRSQFEHIVPTDSLKVFFVQVWAYAQSSMKDFGLFPMLIAAVPFGLLFRLGKSQRRWLLGLLSVFVSTSVLMVALLNPPLDRQATAISSGYFTASHLIVAVWMGYGLVLLGTLLSRSPE
jgi:hypothetical protein